MQREPVSRALQCGGKVTIAWALPAINLFHTKSDRRNKHETDQ